MNTSLLASSSLARRYREEYGFGSSSDAVNSKIRRTGVVSADAGALGEKLHAHALFELEWGALDMGQPSGIEDCDECMGQFLPQQERQAQQLMLWLLCARSDTPGTRERRIESDKAQAFFVILMPCFSYSK